MGRVLLQLDCLITNFSLFLVIQPGSKLDGHSYLEF